MNRNIFCIYSAVAPISRIIIITILTLLLPVMSKAAIRTSIAAGGNWDQTATWGGDPVPVAGDQVIIATTGVNKVTINVTAFCADMTILADASLESGPAITLTITGTWTNHGLFTPSTGIVAFDEGTPAIDEGGGSEDFGNIRILSGAELMINALATTASGTFIYADPVTANSSVTIGSNSLTVSGAMTMPVPTVDSRSCTFNVENGTLTVGGTFTMAALTNLARTNVLNITTGTAFFNGVTTGTTACKVNFSGEGIINIAGTVSTTSPALLAATGTVNYTGGSQNVWAGNFLDLNFSGSGTKTLRGTTGVAGVLTINGVTLSLGSRVLNFTGTGDFLQNNGVINIGTSTIGFLAATPHDIPTDITYRNLVLTNSTKTVPDGQILTITGTLTVNVLTTLVFEGTASAAVAASGIGGATGVIQMGTGTITVSGNWVHQGSVTGGTVHLNNPTANQTVRGTISNLVFSGTGLKSLSNTLYTKHLTIDNGISFAMGTRALNLSGGGTPLIIDGAFDKGTGTILFSGDTEQNIPGIEYNSLTFSGAGQKTVAAGDTVRVTGTWAMGNTTTVLTDDACVFVTGSTSGTNGTLTMNTGTLAVGINFVITTFNAGQGTVHYNGEVSSQNVKATSYYNLEFSGASAKTLATGTTIVNNVATINSGAALSLSSRILTLAGSGEPLVLEGSLIQGTSTVNYTGTSATIVAADYYTLNGTGGDRILDPTDTIRVFNTFTPGAGAYSIAGSTINFNNTGNQAIPAFNYHNLDLRGGGNRTLPANLTIGIAGKFDPGDSIHTVTNNTVHFNGSGSQTIPAFNYNHLDGTGGDRILSSTGTVGIAGTFTPGAGTYTITGSTVHFNRNGVQAIPAFNYHNLAGSGGGRTLPDGGTIGIAGTFDPGAGTYGITNSTIHYNAIGEQTVIAFNYHHLNGTGGDRILAPAGTIGIAGTFTPGAGQYQVETNTVEFNGSAVQTIPEFTFNDLILSNSAKAINAAVTVKTLTIQPTAVLNLDSDGGGLLTVL